MPEPLTNTEFQRLTGVSRETLERFSTYSESLRRWRRAVNLVGSATLRDVWRRHFLDCAQLWPLLPSPPGRVVDLGSGAGFPGLVLAILGAGDVHLIESDGRKVAFLREAARVTGTTVTIHAARSEAVPPLGAGVVTARACAPLNRLLALAARHMGTSGICLFPKGRNVDAELTAAGKLWNMRIGRIPSRSDPSGVILKLEDISRETS